MRESVCVCANLSFAQQLLGRDLHVGRRLVLHSCHLGVLPRSSLRVERTAGDSLGIHLGDKTRAVRLALTTAVLVCTSLASNLCAARLVH